MAANLVKWYIDVNIELWKLIISEIFHLFYLFDWVGFLHIFFCLFLFGLVLRFGTTWYREGQFKKSMNLVTIKNSHTYLYKSSKKKKIVFDNELTKTSAISWLSVSDYLSSVALWLSGSVAFGPILYGSIAK